MKENEKGVKNEHGQKEKEGKNLPNNRRSRRSQSPKKSLSPDKSVSPIETSETQSPQVKRKPKNVKNNEKENEVSPIIEAFKSPKKLRIPKQKGVGEVKSKQSNDFTVDIFTSKTNEEREKERNENMREVGKQVGYIDKIV